MARVVWTRQAIRNLELIRRYIAQFDPRAAQRMAQRLLSAGDSLHDFPHRGRPVTAGKRELPSVPPHVIRCEVRDNVVYILRVRHGARRPD